jgi:hypothetical protein
MDETVSCDQFFSTLKITPEYCEGGGFYVTWKGYTVQAIPRSWDSDVLRESSMVLISDDRILDANLSLAEAAGYNWQDYG